MSKATDCTLTPEQLARLVVANTLRVAGKKIKFASDLFSMAADVSIGKGPAELESLIKLCVADFERVVKP